MVLIELHNIKKQYKDSNVLFNNLSLEVRKGEFLGIVGKSGAGKTTLLNIMGLITEVQSGTVSIAKYHSVSSDGKDAMILRRHWMSYLFQNYGLIEDESVHWNLNLSLEYRKLSKNEKNTRIHEALSRFGLEGMENKKIYQLSGGEQQRVAIARSVLQESKILFADEPTSGLDSQNENYVMSLLEELHNRGVTIVMVTHNQQLYKYFTRKLEIKDGAIIELNDKDIATSAL